MTRRLRPALPGDLPLLAILMQAAFEEGAEEEYSGAQRAAWTAEADDMAAFAARLAKALVLVVEEEGEPAGFAVLEENRRISHVYVHPDCAGDGIGRALVEALAKLAGGRGATEITAAVTDNARGFFDRLGYIASSRRTLALADEWLGVTDMTLTLAPPKDATLQ
jgi:putative acetyltransferase